MSVNQKVFVLEDDAQIRANLTRRLDDADGFACGGRAADLATARQQERHVKQCSIVLVDLQLPDGHGSEYIRELSQWTPRPKIAVISSLGDERNALIAMEAGADGYLLKDADPVDFTGMLKGLLAGEAPISPGIARHLLKKFRQKSEGSDILDPLSDREKEVLNLAAKGYSYGEIGEHLDVAKSTVNTHIKRIYRKLGVNSRAEAVYEAMQSGIIRLDNS